MPRQSHTHQSHPKIVSRLKRAEGHLRLIIRMMEEEHPCVDLAQQLQAVENAIDNAKKALIHDHIDGCFEQAIRMPGAARKAAFKEFRAITKYL